MVRLKLDCSPIGFGAFKIGRNRGTKFGRAYELPTLEETDRLLNGVLDLGINLIDTAPAYGASEERIGRTIAHRRNEFVLSTKVGELFDNGVSRYDFSRAAVEAGVGGSLRRLRTEVLDLLFVHSSPDDLRVLQETDIVPTMVSLRERGWVRGIGFSGYTPDGFRACLEWADVIMATYHAEATDLATIMTEAHGRGTAVLVKKGLGSGRIPSHEAVPFVLRNQTVTSMVVGSLSLDHMRENLRIAQGVRAGHGAQDPGPPPMRSAQGRTT